MIKRSHSVIDTKALKHNRMRFYSDFVEVMNSVGHDPIKLNRSLREWREKWCKQFHFGKKKEGMNEIVCVNEMTKGFSSNQDHSIYSCTYYSSDYIICNFLVIYLYFQV